MRVAACLFLAVALAASAVADEFKGVAFKTPAGWEEATEGEVKVLAPKDLKEGDVLAIIMTGAVPSNGSSWEKQFTDTIALANDTGKASEASPVKRQEGTSTTLLIQTLKLELAPLGKHSRFYAQVSQGDQRVFVTVIMTHEGLVEKYGQAVSDFLASLSLKSAPAADTKPGAEAGKGKIPTGNTPDLYPGSVGWLPSGKGLPIPAPAIVDGKPVGLWWKATTDGLLKKVTHLYLADGTRASNPRLGGGMRYDAEGQRAQKGATGVGTFTIAGGQMVERYDGFVNKAAYVSGSDQDGPFFKVGGAMFRPLIPLTEKTIVGTWQGPASTYKFKADGTYESGMTLTDGEWSVGSLNSGTYILDGYLIMLVPKDAPVEINRFGMAGPMIAKGSNFYFRR